MNCIFFFICCILRLLKPREGQIEEMVFCYQSCYDLLLEKIVLVIEKNLFKQWKVRTIFGKWVSRREPLATI